MYKDSSIILLILNIVHKKSGIHKRISVYQILQQKLTVRFVAIWR